MNKRAYSVSQINEYIASMFKNDYLLHAPVWVQGEVSQCSEYAGSGAVYFTLKDEAAVIGCVMFRADRYKGLGFKLQTGQKVLVCGTVSVYTKNGRYQLIAKQIRLDGIGSLYERYLQIRQSLEEQGMFDPMYKRPIPGYVSRLGVVTSPSGSVVWDVIHVAKQRHPGIQILVYPAKVEGDGAAASLVRGMEAMQRAGVDVIIIGRGGGSLEELWPFNEEIVSQAIFQSSIPVISAVGHETNMMISDLAADLHENAPSTAAVRAVTDMKEVADSLQADRELLQRQMLDCLERNRFALSQRKLKLAAGDPRQKLDQSRMRLAEAERHLSHLMEKCLSDYQLQLQVYGERLRGLSPYAKLEQGYAFVTDGQGRRIVSAAQVQPGCLLTIRFADGAVSAVAAQEENGQYPEPGSRSKGKEEDYEQ